jgi:hypothetical protein
MLLARRLVGGVRLVTVDVRWWNTHFEGVETCATGSCRAGTAYRR